MSQPIYHHRIPQTYMKSWCFSNNSIWVFDKRKHKCEIRNIENICGEKRFYAIKAGSIFTTLEALDRIFGRLSRYQIFLNGNELNSYEKLNSNFKNFKAWDIFYPNGKSINKKDKNKLRQDLSSVSINTIEEKWNIQYENNWKETIILLHDIIVKIKRKEDISLTTLAADTIMKYFIMFDWRSETGNSQVNEILKYLLDDVMQFPDIEIPFDERVYPYDRTIFEELKHANLLSAYDRFFKETGPMYEHYKIYKENLTFLFLIDYTGSFNTSDNPCFTFTNENGYKEPMFVASPNLIISLAKKDPNEPEKYKIIELQQAEVAKYNKAIFDNCTMLLTSQKYVP